jgi:hypothetical protein
MVAFRHDRRRWLFVVMVAVVGCRLLGTYFGVCHLMGGGGGGGICHRRRRS